jgi:DNA-binding MarR family transcriptional regulator
MENQIRSRYPGPEQSPGYQLWRVTNLWQRRMRATLAPLGLTHVQFVLLAVTAWLTRDDGVVTQIQVADAAGTDEMMTSQVLRTLERNNFIVREKHPSDARARRLVVTDSGRAIVVRAMETVENADVEFFSVLGEEEAGLTRMLRALVNEHVAGEHSEIDAGALPHLLSHAQP